VWARPRAPPADGGGQAWYGCPGGAHGWDGDSGGCPAWYGWSCGGWPPGLVMLAPLPLPVKVSK